MILTWGDLLSNWSIMKQENNENREKIHILAKKKNQQQPRNHETSKDICQTPVLY